MVEWCTTTPSLCFLFLPLTFLFRSENPLGLLASTAETVTQADTDDSDTAINALIDSVPLPDDAVPPPVPYNPPINSYASAPVAPNVSEVLALAKSLSANKDLYGSEKLTERL